jgi:hypothetical protein
LEASVFDFAAMASWTKPEARDRRKEAQKTQK